MPDREAELEIVLDRWDAGRYAIDMSTIPPGGQTLDRPLTGEPLLAIDPARFDLARLGPAAYGLALTRALFGDPEVRSSFARARDVARADRGEGGKVGVPLRVRLVIRSSAPELSALLWETLLDPETVAWPAPDPDVPPDRPMWLSTSQNVLLSRFISSQTFRPVLPLSRDDRLTALVLVANPTDLANWKPGGLILSPIDVPGELKRADAGLPEPRVQKTVLAGAPHPDRKGPATFGDLIQALGEGPGPDEGFDILYLVAHGALIDGKPKLYLEGARGEVAPVDGADLALRMRDLERPPRLAVLVSCNGAGTGRTADVTGVLAALGPRLAEAGVPAVVAMHGSVTMELMSAFVPAFFRTLFAAGQVEQAMAAGRGAVLDAVADRKIDAGNRDDLWMPALFSRLLTGRIWYGGGPRVGGFDQWPGLIQAIREEKCTPILGTGLVEGIVGPSRQLAARWAETYHFPMSPHDREDMPQVAQYLAVNQGRTFPGFELAEYLRRSLRRRLPSADLAEAAREVLARMDPPPEKAVETLRNGLRRRTPDAADRAGTGDLIRGATPEELLDAASADVLVSAAGALRRKADPSEPHKVLASLGLPIYITTNYDRQMADALIEANRAPRIGLFGWQDDEDPEGSVFAADPSFRPSANRPLVYHLHGRLDDPRTLVLKEDDYFDYLIGVTGNKDNVPPLLRRALSDSALLLLGFQLSDWDFRVLFRSLESQMSVQRRSNYNHVAVQIDPKGDQIYEPDLARRYLERYFQGAGVSIYWGSVDEFIKELQAKLAGNP